MCVITIVMNIVQTADTFTYTLWEAPKKQELSERIFDVVSLIILWIQSIYNDDAARLYKAYQADAQCISEMRKLPALNNDSFLAMRASVLDVVYQGAEDQPFKGYLDVIQWDEDTLGIEVGRIFKEEIPERRAEIVQKLLSEDGKGLKQGIRENMAAVLNGIRSCSPCASSIELLKGNFHALTKLLDSSSEE